MFIFLSKLLPNFVYPLGLVCIFIILALILYRKPAWQRLVLVLALVVLWLGSTRWIALGMVRSLEWRYLPMTQMPSADAIVLLGGGTESAEYPRQTVELNSSGDRVLYAAWLYKQGKAPHILLSGGLIDWLDTGSTPAEDMAVILDMMGVPKEALWLESTSRNTYENAVNSRKFLNEKGINRIILVTSALHMPRSVDLFKHQGFDVIPAPTDYSVTQAAWQRLTDPNLATQFLNLMPNIDNLSSVTRALKEYLGMLVYRLRGWM
jgi:uncharacterized SAM-binding protein YcdF (DUF218 family)